MRVKPWPAPLFAALLAGLGVVSVAAIAAPNQRDRQGLPDRIAYEEIDDDPAVSWREQGLAGMSAPAPVRAAVAGKGALPIPIATDLVRIHKARRRLELWSAGQLVHAIGDIQLGDAPRGPKRFEGDERTPEGLYRIDWANPRSRYYLSLHISYPDRRDRAYAAARGRSAGGMIMIHGQPNGLVEGRIAGDWTDGCIALSNAQMDLLWASVSDGTRIEILP